MRTALCLYGHFRCFDACWPGLRHYLLDPNGITDVFAAAWTDSMGFFEHPESSRHPLEHPGYDASSGAPSLEYISGVCQILRPTGTSFRAYSELDAAFGSMVADLPQCHHPSPHHRPKGTLGQVWGRCTSIALKAQHELELGMAYDRVVVTRWDIDYTSPIIIQDLPSDRITLDGMYGPEVISDAWACGPSYLVDRWGRQFSGMADLIAKGTMNLGPHEWLRAHFEHHGIGWHNDPSVGIYIRR
jgi:hypothetical protein